MQPSEVEQALHAYANLSALIESTDDLIWSVDLDFALICYNKAFERDIQKRYGVQAEVGMRLRDVIPAEASKSWTLNYKRALKEGTFHAEFPMPDGRVLEMSFHPIVVKEKRTGVVVFSHDISERKKTERALQETEKKYRDIFDGALEGMFQISMEGRILTANHSAATLLGYKSVDELLSKVSMVAKDVWVDMDVRSSFFELIESIGDVRGFECQFKRKDGSLIWASLNSRIVTPTDGGAPYNEGFFEDISERKRVEEELHESLVTLKEAQKIGALGSYVVDFTTGYWSCSDVMDEIFGIGKEFVRNIEGWLTIIHPDDRERMASYLEAEVIGKGKDFNKEYRIVRPQDGAVRWVHGIGRLKYDLQGQLLSMRGVIQDITGRKQATEKLARSEARFRRLFEDSGSVMLLIDPSSMKIVDANQVAIAFYGYSAEQFIGKSIGEINCVPEIEIAENMRKVLCQEVNHFDRCHTLASGELRQVEVYSSMIPVGEKQLIFSIVHDVTDRKRTEKLLSDSEERYRATFEQAAVGIVHTSFEGKHLRCNARYAEMLGYSPEEIPGIRFEQLTLPEDMTESVAVFQRMLSGVEEVPSWEKRYVCKDGSIIWAMLTTTIQRDGEGNPLHILSVVEDISDRKAAEERLARTAVALEASEERYRLSFQMSLDAFNINRLSDGKYIEINKAFLEILGYEREEVIGKSSHELKIWVNAHDRERLVEELARYSSSRNLEAQFKKKNGEIVWGLMSATVFELNGEPCILSVTRDITEAKWAEQQLINASKALKASEERYRTAFQTSLDSIIISRLSDGEYIDVNNAFLKLMGFEEYEVIGRTSIDLNFWADASDRDDMVEVLRQNSSFRDIKTRFVKKSGEIFWVLISAAVIEIEETSCILSVMRDISDAKAAEDKIWNLAFYDTLTHLPNRRLLLDRLQQTLAVGSRTTRKQALLFVDLDNFKVLNDTLGHRTGDLLLQEVARRFATCIRESDTVARLGGDEFVVMLDDLSEVPEEAAAQAKTVGEKILSALSEPYMLAGHECRSSASIGITVFGAHRENRDEVLQQADIAMYQAKTAGRNTIRFFAPALQAAVNARAAMEDDLRQAIFLNQCELFYQPQVEDNRLIGAEALVRWNHPKLGLLSPDEFIPLAEETGLILPLGNWVLDKACAQIVAWSGCQKMSKITIAVNISPRQLHQPEFVESVLAALKRSGANPQNLKLELTEGMLLNNIEEVITKMSALKAHGLRFSLDDFGTGYSSLAYLKRLPLDQLKIDQSFVQDILSDTSSGAIAQTIISLSRSMGLSVIAEGVETEEQRDMLLTMGCHSFQGYLFSRPVPLAAFELFLQGFNENALRVR